MEILEHPERYIEASKRTNADGWFHFGRFDLNESARQEYSSNNCIFAGGFISEESANPPVDTIYLAFEKDGQDALLWMFRPDEMAAIVRIAGSVLWADLISKLGDYPSR